MRTAILLALLLFGSATPVSAQTYGTEVWSPPQITHSVCGTSFYASPTYLVHELLATPDQPVTLTEETNNEQSSAGCVACVFDHAFHLRAGIICDHNS